MRTLRALLLRLRGMFGSERADEDFAAELESHLAMHIEDGMRAGLSEAEARRQALIRLGGLEQTKVAHRERRGLPFLETLAKDAGYALRVLRKNPGYALITIATLALGIGANTALFSIVNGVLLNPLPYPQPDELVIVSASKPNFDHGSVSYPNFRDWQRDNRTLAALGVWRRTSFSLTGTGDAERVRAEFISSDFLPILRIKPVLGRLFAQGEDEIGRGPVALISSGFWARKFGSRPDVLGKTLTLDGRDFAIVGVLPANFDSALGGFRAVDTELYVPIGEWQNTALNNRAAGLGIWGLARLKPGVSLGQAQEDMNGVSDRLAAAFPKEDHGIRAKLLPLRQTIVGGVQPLLLMLLGAVGFVLLIACVNVANLLLARSNGRAQEFAIRSALGAGRMRIVRQLLTESTLLALTGGALGLLLAGWGTRAAMNLVPVTLPRASEVHLSMPVLVFTLFVSLAVGILFGLLPALKVSRQKLQDTLKEGGRGVSGSRHRAQNALVISEMAMALVLLVGAGLMIHSLVVLSRVNPGFQPRGVFTFTHTAPSSMANASPEAVRAYYREVVRRMKQVPGVAGVSLSDGAIPLGDDDEQLFWLENEAKPANKNDMHWALQYTVEPDYRSVMRIPLLRGRFFAGADREHAPRVVVIDDVFARKFFGDDDPVGKHLNLDGFDEKATVVGVVGHVLQWGLDNDSSQPLRAQLYLPFMQERDDRMSMSNLGTDVIVRSDGDTTAALGGIRQAMQQMSRQQVESDPETMEHVISDSLAARRFSMILLAVFAGLALILASVGMYGVISYLVGQRTHEIGIRIALGADRRDVLRWVLQQGGRLTLIGVTAGLIAALALTRIIARSSMLYGVRAYDPWTLAGVTALLMAVALAACYVPATRAMRIDPMSALRNE